MDSICLLFELSTPIYQSGVLILQDDIPNIICNGGLYPGYEKTLKRVRGFGNRTGVAQEMQVRYAKYGN